MNPIDNEIYTVNKYLRQTYSKKKSTYSSEANH